jgi:hypothetical protein
MIHLEMISFAAFPQFLFILLALGYPLINPISWLCPAAVG